jgi:diaminopimelate epimerase
MRFHKYEALGNDYIVLEREALPELTADRIRRLCDRHRGIGSDGVLIEGASTESEELLLRIFNVDGSEAERSGNGLRIFARSLWDAGRVSSDPFPVRTIAGTSCCRVLDCGRTVSVEMGRASFRSEDVGMRGPSREVIGEPLELEGERLEITAVSIGNPHCVLFPARVDATLVRRLGPLLEHHPDFTRRTNVELVRRTAPGRLSIEIWERGVGYTLSSGTGACAAAAAAARHGLVGERVEVAMPGGALTVELSQEFDLQMTGGVRRVASGEVAPELFEE